MEEIIKILKRIEDIHCELLKSRLVPCHDLLILEAQELTQILINTVNKINEAIVDIQKETMQLTSVVFIDVT